LGLQEEYAKAKGVNKSVILRQLLARELLSPELPTQSELWAELRDFIEGCKKTFADFAKFIIEIDQELKLTKENQQMLIKELEWQRKMLERILKVLERHNNILNRLVKA